MTCFTPWRSRQLILALVTAALVACGQRGSTEEGPSPTPPASESTTPENDSLAFDQRVLQPFDPAGAARGLAAFQERAIGGTWMPTLAFENLWLAWGDTAPSKGPAYWQRLRERYGLHEAPFDNGEYPLGLRVQNASVGFDCLLCHADRVAGKTVLGVGNGRLDLQGLFDDLKRMNELAPTYGFAAYPVPYAIDGRTAAAGANDAMGLGLSLASQAAGIDSGIHQRAGYQQAPAWWSLRYRTRSYVDGSGSPGSHRTMMAMLFGSGLSFEQMKAEDALFDDIYQGILSLDPPRFEARTLDDELRARGRQVFDATCASCHGVQSGPDAAFPDHVELAAGTDPVRAQSFDADDAAVVNASWFGEGAPMTATGGYLAPSLRGVWATAPYFHNGSVPTLRGVLDSSARPALWKRAGSEASDYDAEAGGWRTLDGAAPLGSAIERRQTYDTGLAGLSNAGHEYGDALNDEDRAAVVEYLLGL